jgi:hypothetical protein|tara:strand:+ start:1051 stop:1404 length:354 start_codon:yes stop_codon:yes gene_type:complete
MRICNVCKKKKKDSKFKHEHKKTCIRCEFRWKRSFLRLLIHDRRLTAKERISNRLGYMGTAFIMMSPYLLSYGNIGAITYVIGGVLSMPQVFVAKQWNLVAVNLNVTIGYLIYLYYL